MSKTLICEGPPKHEWEHPGGRGRPPKFCPDHKPTVSRSTESDNAIAPDNSDSENPFIKKARDKAKMEKARSGKAERAEEKSLKEKEALEAEFGAIDQRVTASYAKWDELWEKCKTSDDNKLWNQLATAQAQCISVSRRQRFLYSYFESETHPETTTKPVWVNSATGDPLEGTLFDPEVSETLTEELDEASELVPPDDDSGYSDLLAAPEQFDEPYADFADVIEGELD